MPMNDSDLLALLGAEEADADTYQTDVGKQREKAMQYYRMEPYGDEVEERSSVVTSEVMDTIEWAKPALLKMFSTSKDASKFVPMTPAGVSAADQASKWVNHVFWTQNQGFLILHDWITDGLMQKVGIVKAWAEDCKTNREETYEGVTADDLSLMLEGLGVEGDDYEVIAKADRDDGTYDVTVRIFETESQIKVDGVPPEQFRITRATRRLKDARYVAHKRPMTRSELVEMGIDRDKVMSLPANERDAGTDREESSRFSDEQYDGGRSDIVNEMMAEVEVTEAYVRVDYDGDGIAERRRVLSAGGRILMNDRHDTLPFAAWSPILIPHKVIGMSLADLAMPIQRIKSALWRQILDNAYQANNSRKAFNQNTVNADDLLTNRVGGGVRVDGEPAGQIVPIETPIILGDSLGLVEAADDMREFRTGVTRTQQGDQANALHDTSTGLSRIMDAQNERLLCYARIFAETGWSDLQWIILELTQKHQSDAREIMVNGEPMVIDPRTWSHKLTLELNVGLGSADLDKSIEQLSAILGLQKEAMEAGGATYENIYNTLTDLLALTGRKDVSRYFVPPDMVEQMPQGAPAEDPIVTAERVKAESREREAAAKLQLEEAKAARELELAKYKADREADLRKYEIELKHRHDMTELDLKYAAQYPQAIVQPVPGSVLG